MTPTNEAADRPLATGAVTALGLLFLVSLFNYLDRFALGALLPSIKEDMALSDTQLGALSTAFTLSYVLLGVPFARLADTRSRKTIISVSLTIWSAMTVVCGLTQSFIQLAIARVFVGVGEAGATPPSHSLISDYFPTHMRARALSVFGCGAPVGLMIGFVLASWLAEEYSWRIAFFSLGVPGVIFAVAFYFIVREPRRGLSEDSNRSQEASEMPGFLLSFRTLLSSPTFRHLSFASGLYTVVYIGVVSWLPSYFTRSFDMPLTEVGFWLAISVGFPQLIGMLCCGILTDRMIKSGVRWYGLVPAIAMFGSAPLFLVVFGVSSPLIAALALFPAFFIGIFQGPASFAAIQGVSHVRMRATAVALFLLVANLVGGGLGPLLTGWLSDLITASFGEDSLKWSLMLVSVVFSVWAGLHYWLASRSIADEFKQRELSNG